MKTYSYYIHQMHCASCKILVTQVLQDLGLKNPNINLKTKQIRFDTNQKPSEFLPNLTQTLGKYSYKLDTLDTTPIASSLLLPFILSLLFVLAYLLLEKLGLSNLFNPSQINLVSIFVIGIIASLSSCMALVGGLLLSLPHTPKPHLFFHLSRLLSFALLGFAIGLLGKNLFLDQLLHQVLLVVVAISMFLLGISNLYTKSTQILTLPNILGNKLNKIKNSKSPLVPIILGTLTFILPCGFTQSVQLYSISQKDPIISAQNMFVFALGTLPVLAFISIGSNSLINSRYSQLFIQVTSFLLIFFALFNLKLAFRL